MRILAADTSTQSGSVALLEGDRLVCERTRLAVQTHNRRLLQTIDDCLRDVGWNVEQIDLFAVTLGPGSFTGLRIGLTTLKTLAWALRKPLVGVPSPDALAEPLGYASLPVIPLIDAHRQEVFWAPYVPDGRGSLRRVGPYAVSAVDRVVASVDQPVLFCGDGWLAYRDVIGEALAEKALGAPPVCHGIRAGHVGQLALRRFQEGDVQDAKACAPLYVRPSEAEIKQQGS